MTVKEFFESPKDLVIHCKTEEQAKILLNAFDKEGYYWFDGNRYIGENCWEDYKEYTCYSNEHEYSDIDFYQDDDYAIIEFEEIDLKPELTQCNANKMMIEYEDIDNTYLLKVPYTDEIQIQCDKIVLTQNEIEITIDSKLIEKYESIKINGILFERVDNPEEVEKDE